MEKQFFPTPILAILTCCLVASCSQQQAPPEKASSDGPKDAIELSPKAIKSFGLAVLTVTEKSDIETITTTGELKADENRVFHVNSLSSGRVIKDNVMLGDVIHQGQTLAVVQNLDVTKIYGDYIHQSHQNEIDTRLAETRAVLAKKNYLRIKSLYDEKIAAEKDLLKAEADKDIEEETLRGQKEHATHIKKEAQAMLAAYGVNIVDSHSENIENNSPVIAPRGGVIIKKNVTVGDVVTNTEPLYVVGDLSNLWLDIAVYDKQFQSVKIGDAVSFMTDSLPGRSITGHISYIKSATEDASSTFLARAIIDNRHLDLKPGMRGQVSIQSRHAELLPFIPDQALQQYGKESFVFIAESNGSYKKQRVEPSKRIAGGYLIAHGIHAGQRIVGKGSFTLKAEMLKGTMAGED